MAARRFDRAHLHASTKAAPRTAAKTQEAVGGPVRREATVFF